MFWRAVRRYSLVLTTVLMAVAVLNLVLPSLPSAMTYFPLWGGAVAGLAGYYAQGRIRLCEAEIRLLAIAAELEATYRASANQRASRLDQ